MGTWYSQFYLGRPGSELTFDINPNQLNIETAQISARNRVLSGKLRKWVFRTEFPTISLNGKFFTAAQKDQMESLLAITDTMLSFKVRSSGFTRYLEQNPLIDSGTVGIQENSATLLSAALVAAGVTAGSITITGVYDNAAGSGTNYYSGGSYNHTTRVITLGSAMGGAIAYVTYTYEGWLVSMDRINWQALGGHVDVTQYSGWTLEGV